MRKLQLAISELEGRTLKLNIWHMCVLISLLVVTDQKMYNIILLFEDNQKNELGKGAYIGGSIAGAVILIVIICLAVLFCKRRYVKVVLAKLVSG